MLLITAEAAGSLAHDRLFQGPAVAVIEWKVDRYIESSKICHNIKPSKRCDHES